MARMRRGEVWRWLAKFYALVLALALSFGWPLQCAAYAVLAHEAIIDTVWDANIRPLLVKRFPDATPENLRKHTDTLTAAPSSRTWATTRTGAIFSAT